MSARTRSAEAEAARQGRARRFPDDMTVAPWLAPDGWPLRHMHRAAPAGQAVRGSILMLGGRGDHVEKYLETLADWHDAGWVIDSFDWRGQGGSGRLSDDPHVGHVEDYALWVGDLAAFVAEWMQRTPAPHVVIGHSMGGHLVLRALADGVIAPDAAVLVAPMLGFRAPYGDRLGCTIASAMCRIGDPARPAWKVSEKPGSLLRDRQRLLTHDDDRYADEMWWRGQDDRLELGPASWRWVQQAYASFIRLGCKGALEAVKTPVLLLSTAGDALVSPAAIRRAAGRLPNAQYHEYNRSVAHELLREVDKVRDDAIARIAEFCDRSAPRP